MDNTNETFSFTYSAAEQEEVKKIREKYLPKAEDKMEELRKLDASATKKGSAASLATGILSSLILGSGMSMCMEWNLFVPGIAVGVIGIAGIALAYPIYTVITKKEREKIAPEVIRLAEELMK